MLSESYKEYFQKTPGFRMYRSRGKNFVSKLLKIDIDSHVVENTPDGFCVNDNDSALNAIRTHERNIAILDEGLIATYPTDKTLEHYKNVYKKIIDPSLVDIEFKSSHQKVYDYAVISDPSEKISPAIMVCFLAKDKANAEDLIKTLTDEFVKYGYYMSAYDIEKTLDYLIVYLQLEAKYSNMLVELEDTLYHVTPLKYLDRILKNGLVPYAKSTQFQYQPRVYLFNRYPKDLIYDYAIAKARENNDVAFCVFKIKKDKLINDQIFKNGKQKFYLDSAFSLAEDGTTDQTAIFTYGNVPLRVIEDEFVVATMNDRNEIIEQTVESIKKMRINLK